MIEKDITVKIPEGMEARTVAMFVQIASHFVSHVYVGLGDKKVNAKSIMGMMSLGAIENESILVSADGQDEKEAIERIEIFLQTNQ